MAKKRLSESQVIQLINAVRRHPCIWDRDNDNYNNKYFLALAWKNISQEMSMSGLFVRQKWKNLRDILKSIKKKKSVSNWTYYNMLSFLSVRSIASNESECHEVSDTAIEEVVSEVETEEYNIKVEIPDSEEVFLTDEDPISDRKIKTNSEESVDYDMMFLQSLAPFFRQLDPIRKLVVRSKIQDLLMKELAAQESSNKLNSHRK